MPDLNQPTPRPPHIQRRNLVNPLKQVLLNLIVRPSFPVVFKYIRRRSGTLFMLHRIRDDESNVEGFDPGILREALRELRARNYELVSVRELLSRLAGEGPEPSGAVAFTIDDGYREQATIAGPIFAEFECPVTTFVTTGFLDREIWFWWDQVEHIFDHSRHRSLRFKAANVSLSYAWTNDNQRRSAQHEFTERCKLFPNDQKLSAIEALSRVAEVAVPVEPPAKYSPMSWDQVRACEGQGMTFGPHTVTHPILSRTSAAQSREEMLVSWSRLKVEARNPVPVFCYPNGHDRDFGAREIAVLMEAGFLGAVTSDPRSADATELKKAENGAFRIPRFALPATLPHLVQCASGLEHVKTLVRGRA